MTSLGVLAGLGLCLLGGVASMGELVQRRQTPDPDTYFGKGKLEELKQADHLPLNQRAGDLSMAQRQIIESVSRSGLKG